MSDVPVPASGLGMFKGLFIWFYLFILIIVILGGSITDSIKEKSWSPIVTSLGNNFLMTTAQLKVDSQQIIDTNFSDNNKFLYYWDLILAFLKLILAVSIIYHWIKIFAWLFAHSPLGNTNSAFSNYMLALIFFTFFQIIVLLINAGIKQEIHSFSDGVTLFTIPIMCYWTFVLAVLHVVGSLSSGASNIAGYVK